MTYPRFLNLDSDTKERLISFLETELLNHDVERSQMIDEIIRWQADYWAAPATVAANFPFEGACALTIPLTAIAVETIHARIMTTLFALPSFISAKAASSQWFNAARPFERYFDNELKRSINIKKVLENCILEDVKFGTCIAKAGYERIVKYAVQDLGNGNEQEVPVTIKEGACADAVSLSRFIMPFTSQDPQAASWCGEQHSHTPFEIKNLEESGLIEPGTFKKIEAWVNMSQVGPRQERKYENSMNELQEMVPVWPKYIDWVELWMGFDIDKSKRSKEIVVLYHRASQTIMAIRHNWHSDLHRPYRIGTYFPLEHRWRGIGVCKQNEQFSAEITVQHRQRIDNATMANMRMIKINKLTGYGPNEPIYPGKMWFVDSKDDIDVMQMGEIYPSSYNNETGTLQYSQQRTGVNEVVLGMPQVGTPGTATSDLARIQEGNKKFDYIYGKIRDFTNELVSDIAVEMHQFGPRSIRWKNEVDGGSDAFKFFDLPAESIRDGLVFDIKATGQQQNKIVDRQNWTQIAPMYTQYIQGTLQLAQLMQNPQIMQEIITHGLTGATEIMRQILETYDVRDIERLLIPTLAQANGLIALPGTSGTNGASTTGQTGGMVLPPQIAPGVGSGSIQ